MSRRNKKKRRKEYGRSIAEAAPPKPVEQPKPEPPAEPPAESEPVQAAPEWSDELPQWSPKEIRDQATLMAATYPQQTCMAFFALGLPREAWITAAGEEPRHYIAELVELGVITLKLLGKYADRDTGRVDWEDAGPRKIATDMCKLIGDRAIQLAEELRAWKQATEDEAAKEEQAA